MNTVSKMLNEDVFNALYVSLIKTPQAKQGDINLPTLSRNMRKQSQATRRATQLSDKSTNSNPGVFDTKTQAPSNTS